MPFLIVAGAIVTRLAAIEDMAGMAILCSDKTGTLTMNKLVIQEDTPVYREGENQYSLLRYAAMAANWKVRKSFGRSTQPDGVVFLTP